MEIIFWSALDYPSYLGLSRFILLKKKSKNNDRFPDKLFFQTLNYEMTHKNSLLMRKSFFLCGALL